MKVCASCGASLPDGAAFCIGCGSKEFVSETLPDLNAPQPEKPKIEYDQYGRPIGQEYAQSQYEEPRFSESFDDYSQSSYSQESDYPQYIEQYSEQMSQQYQQPQYGQQYQQPYQPQYQQPYQQPQYEPQYQQPQYEQQQYEQPILMQDNLHDSGQWENQVFLHQLARPGK